MNKLSTNDKSEGRYLNYRSLLGKIIGKIYPGYNLALWSFASIMKWGRFPRKFIVDVDKKLVYLNNPKVACSSIKKSILGKHPDIHAYANRYTVNELSGEMKQYYKFTFVRNPYKRLVSCFEDKCLQHPDDICWNYYFLSRFLRTRNFDNFIRKVSLIPDSMAEPHFSGQYRLVYDKKGVCLVDFVGRIENINKEYEPIRERFDLSPLETTNRAASLTGKNWMDYYTPFTAWLVYRKYKKDFGFFGYEEEYKNLKTYLKSKKSV